MTGAAILRSPRSDRVMGIMTGDTSFPRIMGDFYDLRKSGWARRIIAMALGAESPVARDDWRIVIGCLGMLDSRAMTDLAR
jgi:hypothetical protein